MAVKDIFFSGHSRANTHDWKRLPDGTETHLEVDIHKRLTDLNQPHILRYINHRIGEVAMSIRVYADYAPYGSLSGFLNSYRRGYSNNPDGTKHIPEEFLWYTFLGLVWAAIDMQRGTLEEVETESWFEIVHRDLKPDNSKCPPLKPT